MGRRWLVTGVFAAVMSMAFAPLAAADTLVSFETTSVGGRVLTAVAPSFPATSVNLVSGQTVSTTVSASASVLETFAKGRSPWSVTAEMCEPVRYADPTSGSAPFSDCTSHRMVRASGGAAADAILGSAITATHTAPVVTLVDGGTTTTGSNGPPADTLTGQITMLSNTGQNPLSTYNGLYVSTASLSISGLDRIGVWKGMWVVTEVL